MTFKQLPGTSDHVQNDADGVERTYRAGDKVESLPLHLRYLGRIHFGTIFQGTDLPAVDYLATDHLLAASNDTVED